MNAVLRSFGTVFGNRARTWARRRQGTDATVVRLENNRIYILPTKTGFLFGMIIFTMLLGAMNYNNNMGFALTFLLASIGVISIFHCQRNLRDFRLRFKGTTPVFAGEELVFEFLLENPDERSRWQINLAWDADHSGVCCELDPCSQMTVALPLNTDKRGFLAMPRLQISTLFPLGLVRAWSWVNMEQAGLVYPRPANSAPAPAPGAAGRNNSGRKNNGEEDFSGLRAYRTGDASRRIAWKAFARSGEKLIKEYHGGVADECWIDWQSTPGRNTENRISMMARQILDAHAHERHYGLIVPGTRIAPAHGMNHRHHCLRTLAVLMPPAGSAQENRQ
jgi:uncharacterized protein (DUF58 family)